MADLSAQINNMKAKLSMSGGSVDEGRDDNRNGLGTGSTTEWNTYPGEVYATPDSGAEHRGSIAVHFTGRERRADYLAGQQTGTNDTQAAGLVTGRYSIDRDDVVFFLGVTKEGGRGRVGNATVNHVNGVNGQSVA